MAQSSYGSVAIAGRAMGRIPAAIVLSEEEEAELKRWPRDRLAGLSDAPRSGQPRRHDDGKVQEVLEVGLYLYPPDKALILCVDEKSQALDRTQPSLPMNYGMPDPHPRLPAAWDDHLIRGLGCRHR